MNEKEICPMFPDRGHELVRNEKESGSEKEVWNCICGYFVEENNDCGSGG